MKPITNYILRNNIDINWKRNCKKRLTRSISLRIILKLSRKPRKRSRCVSWPRLMINRRLNINSGRKKNKWNIN